MRFVANDLGVDRCRAIQHRQLRRQVTAVALIASWVAPTRALAADNNPVTESIAQPDSSESGVFIRRAFQMRQRAIELGDQPFGAIVVRDGKIIGQSWSRVILDADPTGHAEMSAIRDTAQRGADLSGAVLYSSSRPCSMCEAAAAWCGLSKMIWGRASTNAGAPRKC